MHEAKSRLSELVKAVEDEHETIVLCRAGNPVAEIKAITPKKGNRLKQNPALKVKFRKDFDPTEPASEEDWPTSAR
jgi:antitoxin (DNA-binding transcriptional repressor) of toxin-antitoxin stability system